MVPLLIMLYLVTKVKTPYNNIEHQMEPPEREGRLVLQSHTFSS